MFNRLRALLSNVLLMAENWSNRFFTPKYNPFYYTGAVSVFFMALILISGVYILLFYKISVERAYDSVEYLTREQWYLGGVMRSIHRYAADALIVVLLIHGLRYFSTGRTSGNRWLIWVAGIGIVVFILIEGITGYWMVWDQRSQLIATLFVEFLDMLPIFPKPLARAFLSDDTVTNLFFLLIILLHVAISLAMVALFMLHIARLTRPTMTLPRALGIAIVILMLGLAIYKPAVSAPRADLGTIPEVPMDWFYLFIFPLIDDLPGWASWLVVVGVIFLATFISVLRSDRPVAEVVEENCTGCKLCYKDCPYEAILIRGDNIAEILPEKCSGCGICFGACSFGAIELGELNTEKVEAEVTRLLSETNKIGFVCEHTVRLSTEDLRDVKFIVLRCVGMLNPSIIKHAIASGAESVFIIGCRPGDCYHRLGNKWLSGRLSGERAPILKSEGIGDKIKTYWFSSAEKGKLLKELREERREEKPMIIPALAVSIAFGLFIAHFSTTPAYSPFEEDESVLLFTMQHLSERVIPCQESTMEELKQRIVRKCERERAESRVELYIDDALVLSKTYTPKGIRRDEPTNAYEKMKVKSGKHVVRLRMTEKREFAFEKEIYFESRRLVIIDFDESKQEFYIM